MSKRVFTSRLWVEIMPGEIEDASGVMRRGFLLRITKQTRRGGTTSHFDDYEYAERVQRGVATSSVRLAASVYPEYYPEDHILCLRGENEKRDNDWVYIPPQDFRAVVAAIYRYNQEYGRPEDLDRCITMLEGGHNAS